MLGHDVDQTFSYGDSTEFLQWTGGVPKVVEAGDLDAGDYVRVNVRAPRGSSLATIESTNATLIGDHGTELTKPDKPEYLFRGEVVSTGSSSVTITARGGEHAGAAPPARPVRRPDVHGRQLDDLPALAGPCADGDRALRPEGGGPRWRSTSAPRPARRWRRSSRRRRPRSPSTSRSDIRRRVLSPARRRGRFTQPLRRASSGSGNHVNMTRRRFLLLRATVVALNTFFWLAPGRVRAARRS